MPATPVSISGDPNAALTALAAVMRDVPSQVQPQVLPLIAREVPSTKKSEDYLFVNAVPKLQKVVSQQAPGGVMTTKKINIANDTYEASLAIKREEWDDDQVGLYAPLAAELMQGAILAPEELLSSSLIPGGATATAHDGQYFYDTDHAWPGGEFTTSQVNKQTGAGTTAANIETDFFKCINAMQGWKDDRGRLKIPAGILNSAGLLVHHAPALNAAMSTVFDATAGGESHYLAANQLSLLTGRARRISDPYLSGNDWYVHAIGDPMHKPFVYQTREALNAIILGPGSEHYKVYGEVLIKVRTRFALGYANFERSQMVDN